MKRKPYRAGAVKLSFWFFEFRKAVQLLANNYTWEQIHEMSKEENVFNASTPARAEQIYHTLSAWLQPMDSSFIPLFLESDIRMQKILVLTAILVHDTLFFDFVYEVVREKLIIGTNELKNSEWRIFIANKQTQDERAAKWTEQTVLRLGNAYRTMLYEAGMIDQGQTLRHIRKPILSPAVETWLKAHDLTPILKALTGVR